MCGDPQDLQQRASWDGAAGSSRRRLLVDLQSMLPSLSEALGIYRLTPTQDWIPSSIMIPPRRFPALLDQALRHQSSQCLWHNTPSRSLSLYSDHYCDDDVFPQHNTFTLVSHADEVWNLEWSHSGRRLATASKDYTVVIWSVEVSMSVHVLYCSPIVPDFLAIWVRAPNPGRALSQRPPLCRWLRRVVIRRFNDPNLKRSHHQDVGCKGGKVVSRSRHHLTFCRVAGVRDPSKQRTPRPYPRLHGFQMGLASSRGRKIVESSFG